MKNLFTIILLLVLMTVFGVFIHLSKISHEVVDVISPTKIVVDVNQNKVSDNNEIYCISGIESFSLEPSDKFVAKYTKQFNIKDEDIINLGYLGREYARKTLLNKRISLKQTGKATSECIYARVKINGVNYSDLLYKSGFGIKNNKIGNESKFKQNLLIGRKLNLVILNHHSNKYHKLNCKFGKLAHDKIIIPYNQMPKGMVPCKYCHEINKKLKKHAKNNKKFEDLIHISYLKSPLVVSSGNIKLYKTDFPKHLVPNNHCSTQICQEFVKLVNNSKTSIDIAIYGYEDIPAITNALMNAKNRGVTIRFIYDEAQNPLNTYYKGNDIIKNIADKSQSDKIGNESNKLMHNKFVIFDNKVVFSGSMNFSKTGLSDYDGNDVVVIISPEIANLYTAEFEQMLNGKFHSAKSRHNLSNRFVLGNSEIEVYFSPQYKSCSRVVELINSAKNYIYVPSFLITHQNIANSLVNAQKRRVEVKVILDGNSSGTRNTKHQYLRENGIKLKFENYAGKLHSKTMIIDDEYIIMGSMNFSNSGENKNDENMLVIKNSDLAKNYKEFFLYLWKLIPDKYLKFSIKAESPNSIGSCSDGIDNDFNGKIDLQDSACK